LTTTYNVLFNLALQFTNVLQSSVKCEELCAVRAT